MNGYALVSACDPVPCRASDAAQKHIGTVGNISRTGARFSHTSHNRILDAELQVRRERARAAQSEPNLNLSGVIEIVSRSYSICPVLTELKCRNWKGGNARNTPFNEGGGGWKGTPWNANNTRNQYGGQSKGRGALRLGGDFIL